jgi:hypothetical protein
MSMNAQITVEQEAYAILRSFIPSSPKYVSIDKLDFWLQAYHPDRAPLCVKVAIPTSGQTRFHPLQIVTAPRIRYTYKTPYVFLDQRYRVKVVYSLTNLVTKPFTVQFFLISQDAAGRRCILQIGRRSEFKKDLLPAAAERFELASK